ncbi:DUF3817 domain-containing protein [Angustibacter aerolatus]|uniref:Membrane protein n=1 Tax=Angustibacter aerolatus TaxID=1162965 RepID=A0ABQ6JKR0_9ACTN|nr:DUF3817 domain-containing protein [Angustibacter aerolatus]GMA88141.1 membrane protein [Angustibacter aerolatus]
MSEQVTSGTSRSHLRRGPDAVRGPLLRYRVMAIVTGVMLLLLCLEILLKYLVVKPDGGWAGDVVAIVHGWIYVVYLVTVLNLWSALRWRLGRLLALVLAGVVPGLSFVVERRVVREVTEALATGHDPSGDTPAVPR